MTNASCRGAAMRSSFLRWQALLLSPVLLTLPGLVPGGEGQTEKSKSQVTIKERATLRGHGDAVWSVTFSPDGKTLASVSSDETIKLWDVTTGKERASLRGHVV